MSTPSSSDRPVLATVDGNEAAASVAYRLNEVCAIYPITPSSTMAELADQWSGERKPNIWGDVPTVIEMQSEGGAAGAVHGSLQGGALTTTFTASQGLLLMIPNMYKIAGELTPAVFHVAARALASHALSIFGDHQDVMAVRATGFAQLASASVQEAHDMAAIAQMATLESRIPFVHFFDGFRTSHEIARITMLSDDDLRALIDPSLVVAHRSRALSPDRPFIRGTAQNPDAYFQMREAANAMHWRVPSVVEAAMARFAARTGRHYGLVQYHGAPDAERVIVLMGSGAGAAAEAVEALTASGEKVGLLQIRLFRPFPAEAILAALPATVRAIAVLDRTKEPGANGEPLYQDVVTVLAEATAAGTRDRMPRVVGGRYGLSSKEFTPAMVKAVFDEIARPKPRSGFTVGITDDVNHTSLAVDDTFTTEHDDVFRAVFYGLGADGTVGANKNTIKIIGEDPDVHVQAYFVYDSKKSGSQTVSHLRFGPQPIRSTYLVREAQFIGCHQWGFIEKVDVLSLAAKGATLLLNSPHDASAVWDYLPRNVQERIVERGMAVWVIDANKVARAVGLGSHTNSVLQTCFFAVSGVLPRDKAIEKIKKAIEKTYRAKGPEVVRKNFEAVDRTIEALARVDVPTQATGSRKMLPIVAAGAPAFVRDVVAEMLAGRGDRLPVSAFPIDGTFPSATSRWEKRGISDTAPVWEPSLCIQCGNCSFVCPHAVIRTRVYTADRLAGAPAHFKAAPIEARGFPDSRYTLQIHEEDCTGCSLCVDVCPVKDPSTSGRRAINMAPRDLDTAAAREHAAFFETLPVTERGHVDFSTVRGTQLLEPLFEFSGACAGCGETPYLKLVSQLFGDRMVVANATGCSSIYGGNLPTTPWSVNHEGRGPAWANSLFEDNAEFGLGMRLAADHQLAAARKLLDQLRPQVGDELVDDIVHAPQRTEYDIRQQRQRVAQLLERLSTLSHPLVPLLSAVAGQLVRRSVWIIGGDGWAYDIGSGGLDHVLASGRDVNVLVLDTEVYSNTGGQASKSTPLGAAAKFASAGKQTEKKDIALQAISYGNVYVARIAMGANPQQTLDALREAEAYEGPSLVLAYSHCIAHGIDMTQGLHQQDRAVHSGYWPLVRYNPELRAAGEKPFTLDSVRPTVSFRSYAEQELRYRMLLLSDPARGEALLKSAQEAVTRKWKQYEDLAELR
ncbi:pyruvate-flavodoxin oxidoreductase [Luteitalea sp. TBR-22]|uniref:pyruvate:ferredoxin (flavodoxin) oxidoreductase n=1 Tax=Luteitalea sp. TBR-22 TaxID=2802971 RepID=UPI001AF653DE|nr:pyruvate:ferredoxin (flavodoxin) oxidoreductase [Luteitalea sp. TBR-22]BCS32022.1 pyruvate-flavodoxin oxidoreductase [Luteitalea sp. TBR-22]